MTTSDGAVVTSRGENKEPGISAGLSGVQQRDVSRLPGGNQVQTIAPVELSQVFADCEWVAVALHVWGGPATIAATIVTFCEGVKPCSGEAIVAVPAKYAPLLSAAYCSS